MREIVKVQNDKPVIARNALRKGQAALFDLIVIKIEQGNPITMVEAEHIWTNSVCRNLIDGIPHAQTWKPSDIGVWHPILEPMNRWQIEYSTMNWLTKNIGLLVMRGYLKAIPMIELERSNV